jgi:hypothetical protein
MSRMGIDREDIPWPAVVGAAIIVVLLISGVLQA